MNELLVAQIVEQVLKEIQQPTPCLRTPNQTDSPTPLITTPAIEHALLISNSVITADVLEQQVSPGSTIKIAAGSLVTPTGRDWLREHKVNWQRASQKTNSNTANSPSTTAATKTATGNQRFKLLAVNDFDRLKPLTADVNKASRHCWAAELANDNTSAARTAIAELSRGGVETVVLVSEVPELLACEVNRHRDVKAAVVERAERVTAIRQSLKVNCFCIHPQGKSYFEMRNLLRAIDKNN